MGTIHDRGTGANTDASHHRWFPQSVADADPNLLELESGQGYVPRNERDGPDEPEVECPLPPGADHAPPTR